MAVKYLTDTQNTPTNETIFVTLSDYIIEPSDEFVQYIKKSATLANKGYIVTFGIKPTKPETRYGYVEAGEPLDIGNKVIKFYEKPRLLFKIV